jgi:general secretion pathway protein A
VIALTRFLTERLRAGLTCVLVVDEAHNLSLSALEQLRLLSNLEVETWKLLQIALVGQSELLAKIADPRLRQLRQRVAIEHHLEPLRATDVAAYLRHRVQRAGGRFENLFAAGSEQHFVEFSKGCPRLVNVLADQVLLAAYAKQMRPVRPALIETIAKQLYGHGQARPPAPAPRRRAAADGAASA